jgi:integrase
MRASTVATTGWGGWSTEVGRRAREDGEMGVKIRERTGAWWIFVDFRGRRKAKRVGVGPQGWRAALAAAEKIQAKLALGEISLFENEPSPELLQAAAKRWLKAHGQLAGLRVSTRALYERTLRTYVFPRFGHKAVTDIKREDVRNLVVDLLAQGRSRSLVRNVIAPLRQMFNELIEEGLDRPNPAARIGRYLRDQREPAFRIDPLTPEEEAWFLATARTVAPRHYPLFLCAVRTGLRMGELLGLTWGALDFHSRFVEVRQSLQEGRVELPKNGKIRRVDMSAHLAEELQRFRALRERETLAKG